MHPLMDLIMVRFFLLTDLGPAVDGQRLQGLAAGGGCIPSFLCADLGLTHPKLERARQSDEGY